MSEENSPEKGQEEENSMADQLKSALEKFEGSPSPETIEGWKATHGDVYVSAFSESEIFIFRSLNRAEYKALQEQAAVLDSLEYEEQAVSTCILWSSVKNLESKAGTIPSLLEMIMQNSNFVPPQIAAQLVSKL